MLFTSKQPKNFTDKVSFNLKTIDNGHHNLHYRGVKLIKCPFDYLIYQMLFFEVLPDLIIEIGTNEGGSTFYFSDLLGLINPKGKIHTIDIEDKVDRKVKNLNNVEFFFEGWQGYDISKAQGFQRILVIEDGSHTYEHSLGALKKFSPIVSIGSYYIVEDGIVTQLGIQKKFNGGPQRAIKEFILENSAFCIERRFCDLFGINATFNVNGFLKRIQ